MTRQAAAGTPTPGNQELRVGIVLVDRGKEAVHQGNKLHKEQGMRVLVAEGNDRGTLVFRAHRAASVGILLVVKAQQGLQ